MDSKKSEGVPTSSGARNQKKKKSRNKPYRGPQKEQCFNEDELRMIKEVLNIDSASIPSGVPKKYAEQGIVILPQKNSRFPEAIVKCRLCDFYCVDVPHIEIHLQEARHIKKIQAKQLVDQLSCLIMPSRKIMAVINTLLEDFIGNRCLTTEDYEKRNGFKEEMIQMIRRDFPGCTFELYGSSASGFGFKKSNVNMSFVVPPELNGPTTLLNLKTWLSSRHGMQDVKMETNCDIPFITFFHRKHSLLCEVSLNNNEAVKLSQLLGYYSSLDDRVIPLATIFLQWAKICHLTDEEMGCLPKYAFVVMTVFYLQKVKPPVLPVIPIKNEKGKVPEAQWSSDLKHWHSENGSSVGSLWLDMLKFLCIKFPVCDYIVSISRDEIAKRNIKRYTKRKMNIEDPFQPKKNIATKMYSDSTMDYFLHCLRTTFKYFSVPHTCYGPVYHNVVRGTPKAERIRTQEIVDWMLHEDDRFGHRRRDEVSQPKYIDFEICGTLTVTTSQAKMINERINPDYLLFTVSENNFTGGKKLPVVCIFCLEEGHLIKSCPLNERVTLEQLPVMTTTYIDTLNRVCEYVVDTFSQNDSEFEERKAIVSELESHIATIFPDVKLELFGSSCNGFGLRNSDVDICLTFRGNERGVDVDIQSIIEQLFWHLKSLSIVTNVIPIASAKVPIVKFNHRKSQLDGDISIYNELARTNTKLLKTYSAVDSRVKILGFVMKRFAKKCNICDASRGSLSSYAYILMVIYYLQQCHPPVVPVLQEIKDPNSRQKQDKVEGYNVYFYSDLENLPNVWPGLGLNKTSVGELWCDLLHFYAERFDFDTRVISVRQKRPLLRFSKMWTSKYMAIEDPFDLNHNLGAGLSQRMHLFIIKAFKKGQFHFRNALVGRRMSHSYRDFENVLFNPDKIIDGEVPANKPCHVCGSGDHLMKNCPNSTKKADRNRKNGVPNNNPGSNNPGNASHMHNVGVQYGRLVLGANENRNRRGRPKRQARVFENRHLNGLAPPSAQNSDDNYQDGAAIKVIDVVSPSKK